MTDRPQDTAPRPNGAPNGADVAEDADAPFWRRKSLNEMTTGEWESLCDGCAKCCLLKLTDEGSDEVDYTDVACRLLDLGTCRCNHYSRRKEIVADCVVLRPETVDDIGWLPKTCAYRLIGEGKDLPWWHPLVSGDPETVHEAGVSVRGRAIRENRVREDELEDHIVTWPE